MKCIGNAVPTPPTHQRSGARCEKRKAAPVRAAPPSHYRIWRGKIPHFPASFFGGVPRGKSNQVGGEHQGVPRLHHQPAPHDNWYEQNRWSDLDDTEQ
jgi:hypothetical protein